MQKIKRQYKVEHTTRHKTSEITRQDKYVHKTRQKRSQNSHNLQNKDIQTIGNRSAINIPHLTTIFPTLFLPSPFPFILPLPSSTLFAIFVPPRNGYQVKSPPCLFASYSKPQDEHGSKTRQRQRQEQDKRHDDGFKTCRLFASSCHLRV